MQNEDAKERLWELHRLMLDTCIQTLQSGKPVKGSTLKEIRGFLQDNGIQAGGATDTYGKAPDESALDYYARTLPPCSFDREEDDTLEAFHRPFTATDADLDTPPPFLKP